MGKIREIAGDGAPMPGFDDGMVDVAGPMRAMAAPPVNEAMGAFSQVRIDRMICRKSTLRSRG